MTMATLIKEGAKVLERGYALVLSEEGAGFKRDEVVGYEKIRDSHGRYCFRAWHLGGDLDEIFSVKAFAVHFAIM